MNEKEAIEKLKKNCSQQEKCVYDAMKKLAEWDFSPSRARQITDELVKEKFIDNQRYAVSFANDKFRFQKWGKIKIAYQLKMKNIDEVDIRHALNEIDSDDYEITVRNELTKKRNTLKSDDKRSVKTKLIRFGQSRGYEFELVKREVDKMSG